MSAVRVITNNVPREIIDASMLTADERAQFDYLDWTAIDDGNDSASFVRYKGELYDLGTFMADYGITRGSGLPSHLVHWHGYMSDSAFSAYVVRYVDNYERVVMGRMFA